MGQFVSTDPEVTGLTQWIIHRLGYPVVTVELHDEQITHCFNEAIDEYSSFINEWSARNHLANALGLPADTDFTLRWVSMNFDFERSFAQAFSEQAGVGGETPYRRDYITLAQGQQIYELPTGRTINEIMWQAPPAIDMAMYADPLSLDAWTLHDFGWTYYGQPMRSVTPLYYTIQAAENIELRQRIYKGDYTYKLNPATGVGATNLTIYPPPTEKDNGTNVWYYYYLDEDRESYRLGGSGTTVSDPGTIKFEDIPYSAFNSFSRTWINKWSFALSKEILGRIRSKFSSVSIPDAEVTLDGDQLIAESKDERDTLREFLEKELEKMDISEMLKTNAEVMEAMNNNLSFNPTGIYMM